MVRVNGGQNIIRTITIPTSIDVVKSCCGRYGCLWVAAGIVGAAGRQCCGVKTQRVVGRRRQERCLAAGKLF